MFVHDFYFSFLLVERWPKIRSCITVVIIADLIQLEK